MMSKSKGSAEKILKAIIISAYERPRYNANQLKESSIKDFSDEWYLDCVKKIDK